jgi:hypothetical protein
MRPSHGVCYSYNQFGLIIYHQAQAQLLTKICMDFRQFEMENSEVCKAFIRANAAKELPGFDTTAGSTVNAVPYVSKTIWS